MRASFVFSDTTGRREMGDLNPIFGHYAVMA
jgi:hypothetical protein